MLVKKIHVVHLRAPCVGFTDHPRHVKGPVAVGSWKEYEKFPAAQTKLTDSPNITIS